VRIYSLIQFAVIDIIFLSWPVRDFAQMMQTVMLQTWRALERFPLLTTLISSCSHHVSYKGPKLRRPLCIICVLYNACRVKWISVSSPIDMYHRQLLYAPWAARLIGLMSTTAIRIRRADSRCSAARSRVGLSPVNWLHADWVSVLLYDAHYKQVVSPPSTADTLCSRQRACNNPTSQAFRL